MENSVLFENFLKNIIYLQIDNKTIDLTNTKLTIDLYVNKYKPSIINYVPKHNLFVDGKKCLVNKQFYLQYKCCTCQTINTISCYKRLISKLLKKETLNYCVHCLQKHDLFGYNKLKSQKLKGKQIVKGEKFSLKFVQNESIIDFQNQFQQFKDDYWKRNYTKQEWQKFIIDYNVIKINSHELDQIEEFIPYGKCYNQIKYSPKIKVNNIIEPVKSVYCECENCNSAYKIHWKKDQITNKKNKYCRNCFMLYFSNNKWRIKDYKNINNDKILYQSQYQLQFIKWCNKNNILIYNGPSLDYFWNKKCRKYIVDFYIPKLKTLIQLKDYHKYYKDQVNNGKQLEKQNAAKKAVMSGKFNKYILLFKKQFTNSWKQQFLQFYNNNIV